MAGKRLYGVALLTLFLACVFSFRDTNPSPLPVVAAAPSAKAKTRRAVLRRVVLEQRAIVDELQRTADDLEKDVDVIHGEICP